ncbi:MAG: DUF4287 domain-containing protein [Maricaulaceae bacterium]|nr:DUF4287 domain-containing protein [Maricaulaceae bacterium]
MASPEDAVRAMEVNLEAKTGKSVAAWVQAVRAAGLDKHGAIVAHLKSEHGLGHGYANLVAHRALASSADMADAGDLIAAQYSGAKAGLKPVYDRLAEMVSAFGPDVELSAKKTYVSLRRKKQFGLIQPSTATRVDVGINLKGAPPQGRLEASGSFNSMVTHRVRVESPDAVDAELAGWLKAAYDAAG